MSRHKFSLPRKAAEKAQCPQESHTPARARVGGIFGKENGKMDRFIHLHNNHCTPAVCMQLLWALGVSVNKSKGIDIAVEEIEDKRPGKCTHNMILHRDTDCEEEISGTIKWRAKGVRRK